MLTSKRFDGDYSLVSTNKTPLNDDPGFATIIMDTNLVDVKGNLIVRGTAVFIDEENVTISDNIVTLNKGEVGAGVTAGSSGIEIDRGSLTNAFILFDEVNDTWVVDKGNAIQVEIVTAALGTTFLINVVEDSTPQLGGDLDVNLNSIVATANNDIPLAVTGSGDIVLSTAATGEIVLAGPVMLQGAAPNVTPSAGEAALFKGADTGGGTQVHYENDTTTGELVSKAKAITYGLIF